MSAFDRLKTEIATDPLGRGYAGMTDAAVVNSLRTVNRTLPKPSLTGDEVFQATSPTEFAAVATGSEKRQLWMSFCARGSINPFAAANVAFVRWVFGASSATETALAALRERTVSRSEELELGKVREGEVSAARL